jgi:hypothetical protein
MTETQEDTHPNPHLQHEDTGTQHGVPAGVAEEESKGLPTSDRHKTESAPIHPGNAAQD